ncbi:MAG: beta-hydroxyacyl-ACP dehydratase [Nitrospiraceae bacterium]|nr:MAG: beta-hydroxyacyl-ACP dehydratase [Nitrospiraceae bacterium]
MLWDKEKIESVLPQREPFLFIDEVMEIHGDEKIVAVKNVKGDEYYFRGHFPGKPIMPGVLIIEAMAQASILLYSLAKPEIAGAKPDYYMGKVKAEFLIPVYPGDRLVIEAIKVKILDYAVITDCVIYVKDEIAAKANLVFAVRKNGE